MSLTELNLVRYCGLTFARCKVASLFTIFKEDLNILDEYEIKFKSKGFNFRYFYNSNNNLLLYVYHKDTLHNILFNQDNKNFLKSLSYQYDSFNEALDILSLRLKDSSFPHEIGIFLGYPLEDVIGFTYSKNSSLTHKYWRVYHDIDNKLKLFKRLDKCLLSIFNKVNLGYSLDDIFLLK